MEFPKRFVCECAECSTYEKHVPAPLFRKSFFLPEGEKGGEILISGLGFYDLFLNGKKITKGFLAPYISNPDHLVYYDHYDLTPHLRTGENVVGVMLGDGFQNSKTCVWDFAGNVFNGPPRLALTLSVTHNGRRQEFDAMDFRCKKGPVWFNDLRSGVFFDRRAEEPGWNGPGFAEDESWHPPIPAGRPRGTPRLCQAEPIVITRELSPVRITKGRIAPYTPRQDVAQWLSGWKPQEPEPAREGGYLYDFGENNAGIFRLRIRGTPGQRIDIQCAELLSDGALDDNNISFYPDGYAQRDLYIVGSGEEEVFEPMFTYHGFRYLYISGITESQAKPELLTYLVMSSGLEERGSFLCSDETANAVYRMARRSDRSNFYYFPTDCPHREKNGWTGDAQVSAEHMILTMGVEKSWREWLHSIRKAQTESGKLPGVIPTDVFGYDWGNGPAWDRVLFELPYLIYKYRGQTDVLKENAHAMLGYLEYISRRRDSRGIIAVGLGDWVPVGRAMDAYQAPLGFTDSVMVLQMCREAEEMFEAIGLPNHARFARQLGLALRQAIRAAYLDLSQMLVESACQTAQAMGIFYDIFDPGEKPAAFRQLMNLIHRDREQVTCGFLGLRVLFHVLASNGEAELAYRMITGTEYPSYGYLVKRGDTTLPEQFLPEQESRGISRNHHFLGDVVQWYMRYPGGIRVINHKTVEIHPRFIGSLDFVRANHILPDGEVAVFWKREADTILLEVTCPEAVDCRLVLDSGYVFAEAEKARAGSGAGTYRICKGN